MNIPILAYAYISKNIPIYAHWGITHRCNLRCRMCGVREASEPDKEMSIPQIEKMANNLSKAGVQMLSVGGGEPFVRDDLPEAVEILTQKKISVRILTNGFFDSYEKIDKIIEAGVSDFSVSLDSLNQDVFDKITGTAGSFEKAVKTIKYLSSVSRRKKGIGLINTVVSRENIECLDKIVDFAGENGFLVSFIPFESGHFGIRPDGAKDMAFNKSESGKIKTVFENLIKIKKKGAPIFNSSSFLSLAASYLSGEKVQWKCHAGSLYFSINPEGNFSTCHFYNNYKLKGNKINVFDDDFIKILKSEDYKRKKIEMTKDCRECLRPCWAEISCAFSDISAAFEAVKNLLKKM